jgi:hypothetical protein
MFDLLHPAVLELAELPLPHPRWGALQAQLDQRLLATPFREIQMCWDQVPVLPDRKPAAAPFPSRL